MIDLDALADGEFRDQAIAALAAFTADWGFPVKRSQVEGLRQISVNEPRRLLEFARHQRVRAERREEKRARGADREVAFWKLVEALQGTENQALDRWSLRNFALRNAPPGCQALRKPHGSAPLEEHRAYKEARERLRDWHERRILEDPPVFFRRFCAHYLYLQALQPANQPGGDVEPAEDQE
jgi:hypothetical protein